jgi:hypothetical protein
MGYRRQETERPQSYPSHPNCIVQFLHLKTDCEAIDIDCQICLDPNNQWTSACEVEEICFDFDSCSGDSQNVSEDPLCSIDPNERNNRTIGEVSQALVLFEEDPKGTAFHEPLIVVQTSPVSNSSLPNQQKR